jgi:hypothetical protein
MRGTRRHGGDYGYCAIRHRRTLAMRLRFGVLVMGMGSGQCHRRGEERRAWRPLPSETFPFSHPVVARIDSELRTADVDTNKTRRPSDPPQFRNFAISQSPILLLLRCGA